MTEEDGSPKSGERLHAALSTEGVDAARDALATEAARILDRLDELDRIIAGKGVLELMRFRLHEKWGEENDRTVLVEVKFDNVLGEARQQANVLRQLLVTLGLGKAEAEKPEQKGSPLDELAKRRAARGAAAAGSRRSPR